MVEGNRTLRVPVRGDEAHRHACVQAEAAVLDLHAQQTELGLEIQAVRRLHGGGGGEVVDADKEGVGGSQAGGEVVAEGETEGQGGFQGEGGVEAGAPTELAGLASEIEVGGRGPRGGEGEVEIQLAAAGRRHQAAGGLGGVHGQGQGAAGAVAERFEDVDHVVGVGQGGGLDLVGQLMLEDRRNVEGLADRLVDDGQLLAELAEDIEGSAPIAEPLKAGEQGCLGRAEGGVAIEEGPVLQHLDPQGPAEAASGRSAGGAAGAGGRFGGRGIAHGGSPLELPAEAVAARPEQNSNHPTYKASSVGRKPRVTRTVKVQKSRNRERSPPTGWSSGAGRLGLMKLTPCPARRASEGGPVSKGTLGPSTPRGHPAFHGNRAVAAVQAPIVGTSAAFVKRKTGNSAGNAWEPAAEPGTSWERKSRPGRRAAVRLK